MNFERNPQLLNTPISVDTIIDFSRRDVGEDIDTYKYRMRGFASLLRNQMKRGLIADHGEHLRFLEEVDETRQSSGTFRLYPFFSFLY